MIRQRLFASLFAADRPPKLAPVTTTRGFRTVALGLTSLLSYPGLFGPDRGLCRSCTNVWTSPRPRVQYSIAMAFIAMALMEIRIRSDEVSAWRTCDHVSRSRMPNYSCW